MRFKTDKLFRIFLAVILTISAVSTLMSKASAKHRSYRYYHHQRLRHHGANRYGKWIKCWYHNKVHSYWYRYKTGYYHKGHWIKYHRHHRKHHRASKVIRVNHTEPEVNYRNKEIDSLDNVSQLEYQTVKMINVDRAAHNLRPLRFTVALRRLARARANQSARLDYLTHKDSRGRNYYEQDAKRMKIRLGAYSGENIASAGLGPIKMDDNPHVYSNNNGKDMANMDEDEMVYHDGSSNWGHRYNTLNSHYSKVGIGAMRREGTNNYYLAENFSS